MALTPENREIIYNALKSLLSQCTPPMVVNKDDETDGYGLMGNKPVPYGYDKKIIPGMYFSSIMNRKDSVAFYFFPCYYNEKMKELAPETWKLLKGKTCFHFKKPEQVNKEELERLLQAGIERWKADGYMLE